MLMLSSYLVTTSTIVGDNPDDIGSTSHHHHRGHHHIHGDHDHNHTHNHQRSDKSSEKQQASIDDTRTITTTTKTKINTIANKDLNLDHGDLPHCVDPSVRLQPCRNNDTYCGDWDIKNRRYIPNNCYYRDFTGEQARKCIGE